MARIPWMSILFRTGVCLLLFVLALGCRREPQKKSASHSSEVNEILTTTLLATIGINEQPGRAVGQQAVSDMSARQGAADHFTIVFSEVGGGVAYIAQKDRRSYVVHNGRIGKAYDGVGLPVLSRDGLRIAYGALVNDHWRLVVDGKESKEFDAVGEPVFSPDGQHLAYTAKIGMDWHVVVDEATSERYYQVNSKPAFSSDSAKLVYTASDDVDHMPRLIVSGLLLQKHSIVESCVFMLASPDKKRVAAIVVSDGKTRVIEFGFENPKAFAVGATYDLVGYISFSADNLSVSYNAQRSGLHYIVLKNKEEQLPDASPVAPPAIRQDNKGVGILLATTGVFLHQAFYREGLDGGMYDEADHLTYGSHGDLYAFSARKGRDWFVVVNGKEGPAFERVVMPLIENVGKRVIYRARKEGRRFIVIADAHGRTIIQHPSYEQVFQPKVTSDGRAVAYGLKDGRNLIWKVEKLPE